MADANLLKAISDAGKGNSLNDLVLFGRVRCAIKRPKVVGSKLETVDYGAFAILDAFAIKCLKFDYFRDRNSINEGSLIIYIDDTKWVGKDVKVYGTRKGYGTKVRRQWGAVSESDGVTALAFKMVGSNFVVTPNAMIELGKKDPDAKLTPLEDFVVKLKKNEPTQQEIDEYNKQLNYYNKTRSQEKIDYNKIKELFEKEASDHAEHNPTQE